MGPTTTVTTSSENVVPSLNPHPLPHLSPKPIPLICMVITDTPGTMADTLTTIDTLARGALMPNPWPDLWPDPNPKPKERLIPNPFTMVITVIPTVTTEVTTDTLMVIVMVTSMANMKDFNRKANEYDD